MLQGQGGDWHIEAPKMASIYGGAVLTVAFSDKTSLGIAATASGGIFVQGLDVGAIRKGQSPPFDQVNPESIYAWLDRTGNFPSRPKGELDERGWTFQEKLLSRRILSVTEKGLFWDCLRLSACDWRPLGFRGDFSPKFRDSDERRVKTRLFGSALAAPETASWRFWLTSRISLATHSPPESDNQIRHADLYLLWRRILQDYSARVFTHPGDRVIAIQGVIERMCTALKDDCILGVWRGDALRSLIWFVQPDDDKTVILEDNPAILAPSWSWASVSNPIQYRLWHPFMSFVDRDTEFLEPCSAVTSIRDRRIDSASFKRFVGSIGLTGPLAWIDAAVVDSPGCKVILDPRPRDFYRESETARRASWLGAVADRQEKHWRALFEKLAVMAVLEGGYSATSKAQYCLILAPWRSQDIGSGTRSELTTDAALGSTRVFRRLGLLVADKALKEFCVNDPKVCQDEACRIERSTTQGGKIITRRCEGTTCQIYIL